MGNEQQKTRGDLLPADATAERTLVDVATVAHSTPVAYRPDMTSSLVGDIAIKINAGGTPEEVLQPLEEPTDAHKVYRLYPYIGAIIEAFNVNVYGSEFAFEAVLDLDDPKVKEEIKECLEYQAANGDFDKEVEISDDEVAKELERLQRRMRREKIFLQAWFDNACPDMGYHALSVLTGQDKGIEGRAYWEVVRENGKPRRLVWAPAWTIRAKKQDAQWVAFKQKVKKTKIHWDEEIVMRRFRSWVQLDSKGSVVARYKEFGDPRVMSRDTGKYYNTLEDMWAAEEEETQDEQGNKIIKRPLAATELLDFKVYYCGSAAYGKPKWTSNYPDLIGMRDLAEENRLTVTDQATPNLLGFIAGARVDDSDIERMEEKIEQRKPGEKKIMFIRAYAQRNAPTGPSTTPQIHIERLRDAQNTDGLGMNYIKQGDKTLRRSYRMPKVSLGDDDGINRATAYGMFRFTEDQVYDPERTDHDDRVNITLLPDLNIQLWKYKTLSRAPKDPELLANMVKTLAQAGVLTPDEGRLISEQIFNMDFKDLSGAWTKLPTLILNAVLQTKNRVTAAAILADDEDGQKPFLEQLRESVLNDLQDAGMQLPRSRQDNDNPETGQAGVQPESGGRGAAGGKGPVPLRSVQED